METSAMNSVENLQNSNSDEFEDAAADFPEVVLKSNLYSTDSDVTICSNPPSKSVPSNKLPKIRRNSIIERPTTASGISKPAVPQSNFLHAPGTMPKYMLDYKKKSKEDSRPSSKQIEHKPPAIQRAMTSNSITKFQPSMLSEELNLPHKLGSKPKFPKKDPESEIFQKFSAAKKKFELEKAKLTVLQQSVVKTFKECKSFAKQAPNKITFDDNLDMEMTKVVQSHESFQDIKEYLDTVKAFLEDLKKQAQDGGDQNLEFLGMKSKSFEKFEKRMTEFIEQFQKKVHDPSQETSKQTSQNEYSTSQKDENYLQLLSDNEELKQKLRREEHKTREQFNKLMEQSKQMKALKEKLDEAEKKIMDLEKSQVQREVVVKNFMAKIKKQAENEKQMDALIKELEKTKNENHNDQDQYQKEVETLRQNHENQLKELKDEIRELKKKLELKENELIQEKKDSESFHQFLEQKDEEINDLKKNVSMFYAEGLKIKQSLDEKERFCEEILCENQELQKKIEKLQQEFSELNSSIELSGLATYEDTQKYVETISYYQSKETEYKNEITSLRRNLENELYEKSNKDGLLDLRAALILVMQEKEVAYKAQIESMEIKLKNAFRSAGDLEFGKK